MSKIIVIGAGMVGSAMALDLSKKHTITLVDIDIKALNRTKTKDSSIEISTLNVTDKTAVTNFVKPFDLVVLAVPGFLGFETLKTLIEAKKDVIDISFFPENSLDLDQLAKDNNVTIIADIGVAPGMPNIILGYFDTKIEVTNFEYYVGGLPKVKTFPFNYKAPFSPCDVIEEYTRPARYVENNNIIIKPAMSDIEHMSFDKVGTLEAFNTDGLRSLVYTMNHIPNMKEKTLRYPGHIEYIQVLNAAGFLNTEKIEIDGVKISPLDFSSKILFNDWKLGETEEEFTVMRIIVEGQINGKTKRITYNVYDEYNSETQVSSMARTTGYTATAAANLFLDGLFTEKGVFPPELVGKNEVCFNYFFNYLEERDIHYIKKEETI